MAKVLGHGNPDDIYLSQAQLVNAGIFRELSRLKMLRLKNLCLGDFFPFKL